MNADTKELKENRSLGAKAPNEPPFFGRKLRGFVMVLDKVVGLTNNVTHKLASILLFSLMVLTSSDVAGRYFFNSPITGTYELTGLFLAIMVFFSLGATQIAKEHISIDFLVKKFPLKIQHIFSSFMYLVLLIILFITSWELVKYTQMTWESNEVTGDLELPLFIFIILATIGMFCYTLSILLDFFKSILKVVEKNES